MGNVVNRGNVLNQEQDAIMLLIDANDMAMMGWKKQTLVTQGVSRLKFKFWLRITANCPYDMVTVSQ
jgi:hypothetical protein